MKVNGVQNKLWPIWFLHKKESQRFRMTWGWTNYATIIFFRWTIPFKFLIVWFYLHIISSKDRHVQNSTNHVMHISKFVLSVCISALIFQTGAVLRSMQMTWYVGEAAIVWRGFIKTCQTNHSPPSSLPACVQMRSVLEVTRFNCKWSPATH